MMNNFKKLIALTAAVCVCAMPCAGYAEVSKSETIYVKADPSGNANTVIVEDHLENPDGLAEITDSSTLTGISNQKGDETFTQNGSEIVWQANGNDIYYSGETTAELPVGMAISYELDGKQVNAEDIIGESGHIKITVNYSSTATASEGVVPMLMLTAVPLDSDKFTNITVDNGKIVNALGNMVAVGIGMPGLDELLDIEDNELTEDVDIPVSFTIEADVTDFSMSMTLSAAMPMSLASLNLDDLDDIDDIKDKIQDLTDASTQLVDGSGDLKEGVDTLVEGVAAITEGMTTVDENMDKLVDGLNTMNNSKGDLIDGVDQLADGASKLSTGASDLKSGVQAYTDGAATLKNGIDQYVEGVESLASGASDYVNGVESLTSGMGDYVTGAASMAAGITAYVSGTQTLISNMKDYIDGVNDLADGAAAYVDNAGTLTSGLSTYNTSAQTYFAGVKQVLSAIAGLKDTAAAIDTPADWTAAATAAQGAAAALTSLGTDMASIQTAAATASTAIAALKDSIADDKAVLATITELRSMIDTYKDMLIDADGLYEKCDTATSQLNDSITKQQAALDAYKAYMDSDEYTQLATDLADMKTQVDVLSGALTEAGTYATGVLTVKGTIAAVADSAAQLAQSTGDTETPGQTMSYMLNTLAAGGNKLAENDTTLKAGAAKVKAYGTALKNGADTLSGNDALLTGSAAKLSEAGEKLEAGAKQLTSNDSTLLAGAEKLSTAGNTLKSGAATLTDNNTALNSGAKQLESGAKQLSDGTGTLQDGTEELSEGIEELADGSIKLKDGTSQLSEAGQSLTEGVDSLQQGANDLSEGMSEFDTDGIQTISDLVNIDAQELLDAIDAAEDNAKAYTSWTGIADGMSGTVRFVIETEAIE